MSNTQIYTVYYTCAEKDKEIARLKEDIARGEKWRDDLYVARGKYSDFFLDIQRKLEDWGSFIENPEEITDIEQTFFQVVGSLDRLIAEVWDRRRRMGDVPPTPAILVSDPED